MPRTKKNPPPEPTRQKGLEEIVRERLNEITTDVAVAGCNAVDQLAKNAGDYLKRKLLDGLSPAPRRIDR